VGGNSSFKLEYASARHWMVIAFLRFWCFSCIHVLRCLTCSLVLVVQV
ncbi:hypothetical protein EJB05_46716, partial [Eragrostis curvula]